MPPKTKTPARRTLRSVTAKKAAEEREERRRLAINAYRYRQGGMDWWQIAEKLETTPQLAKKSYAEAIEEAAELVDEHTKSELLRMEVSRLDQLQAAIYPAAMGGDIGAVREVRAIIKERAELLKLTEGQVGPQITTVVVPGTSEAYITALRELAEGSNVQVVAGEVEGTAS